ncbi:MAG: alpha/beta hydrolase [Methyloversatilis sp.]|jgi:alpha/beta superfamily hydrolase|nr:alpha/beta hydrolase [Methyloversatilis sp.]MBP6195372.1 alpha/beta hydrolase [Methyloversatilis sp.]MBP9117288.1 alpha/beta hydrolase [Methyloversatilis sp.]
MSARIPSERSLIAGPVGNIEVLTELPDGAPRCIALVGHPHPLFGGTMDNKVVLTVARALRELGCIALRPQFRGVGRTEGTHDEGRGETEDQLAVIDHARATYGDLPVIVAGFSFGAFVATRVADALSARGRPVAGMVLVGLATGAVEGIRHYETGTVRDDALVIHGENDQVVPLAHVLAWAAPQNLPVNVLGDTGHFFHGKLHVLRVMIERWWRASTPAGQ